MEQQRLTIIVPKNNPPMTPEQAAESEDVILMTFPRKVHLTLETNKSILFPAGVNEVPRRFADHWFLKAQEVELYQEPVTISRKVAKEAKVS